MKWTLAIAQIDCVLGDLDANITTHLEFISRAKAGGANLVVFPELSLTGYSMKDANWDLAVRASDRKRLSRIIEASKGTAVLFGGVEESEEFGIHNSAFLADNGELRTVHRKIYLPTYGMFEESRYFSPGTTVRAFNIPPARIGAIVCEDLWHLPLPYILAKDGAEMIVAIAASPTRLAEKEGIAAIVEVNSEHHRAYARLLSTYLVYSNRVGYEDGVSFWGGSEVIAPNGEVVVRAKLFEQDLVFAEINPAELRRARRFSRHFLDDNPDLIVRELERIRNGRS